MEIKRKKGKSKKPVSIFRLFLKQLVGLSVALILLAATVFIGVAVCMRYGIVLPADYADEKISEAEERLTREFDKNLLPAYSCYALLDSGGKIIETDMGEKDLQKARTYFSSGRKPYYVFYRTITQESGDHLVIKYDMLMHFSNPLLNRIIPYPEFTEIVIVMVMIVVLSVITALRFSKKLKKNLAPIVTATQKIEAQDLEFEIEPTQIAEFNASLEAIEQLKEALSIALKKQWDDEQQRKVQLSALAHDIKTPLTVMKGNTELLQEEEHSEENMELLSDIQSSAGTIETYLELLMDVVNHESLSCQRENVAVKDFLDSVSVAALPLCKLKNIKLNIQEDLCEDKIYADQNLLKRAVVNVIDNAVRYTEDRGWIELSVSEEESEIQIKISDSGKGFSGEALIKAAEQFYTEDASRTNHNYGLGLSFTKRVCEMHGGTLEVGNNQSGGAWVLLTIKRNKIISIKTI